MISRIKLAGPVLGAMLLFLTLIIALALSDDHAVAGGALLENGEAPPSCRAGVSAVGADQVAWVDDVGAGWYVFFGGFAGGAENGAEIVPFISVNQDKDGGEYLDSYTINPNLDGLLLLLQAYPGTLWIVGNEVDRGPDPGQTVSGQGDTFPDVYATAYHEVYHFIKQHDPTAQVANSALVQVTPGRLQYLDLMWRSYMEQFGEPMPVDVWNMHVYVLPEAELDGSPNGIANVALGTDPALAKRGPGVNSAQCALDDIYCYAEHDDMTIFDQQVRAMRGWMHDHGQEYKPLMLSEFSILYPYIPEGGGCFLQDESGNCFDPQRVQDYLKSTMAYLENATDYLTGYPLDGYRLVQQWSWFSISNWPGVGYVSDLVQGVPQAGPLTELTDLGQQFSALVADSQVYVNLTPGLVSVVTADTPTAGGTVDVPLSATIANNGNIPVDSAFRVTFYEDSALTQIIGQAEVPAPGSGSSELTGCARHTIQVSTTWPSLAAGWHPYWVEVDTLAEIEEGMPPDWSGEDDNVASGFVLVNPQRMRLPLVDK